MIGGLFTSVMYNAGNNLAAFGGAFAEKGNYSYSGNITSTIYNDYTNDAKSLFARGTSQFKRSVERIEGQSSLANIGRFFGQSSLGVLNYAGAGLEYGMGLASAGTFGVAGDIATSITKPLSYGAGAFTKGVGGLTLSALEKGSVGLLKLADNAAAPLARGAVMGSVAGAQVAGTLAVEAAGVAAAVGTALWKTRRNPAIGLPVFLGSLVVGGAMGGKSAGINSTMNLENTNVIQPNYYFDNAGMTPGSNNPTRTVDTMGASGDLVFALNNSRKGGFL